MFQNALSETGDDTETMPYIIQIIVGTHANIKCLKVSIYPQKAYGHLVTV